ncbi:helix-turn-helix domain-containing protein [Nonomuraea sp. NEAU-A123]|uniref:helix-turn-helix domain-containing protein n=1 Tax=Nonomuraea sp. NEAU-A123 TaxID=2839649 RepID=UPI001BE42E7E|nr:helix-turn-helix transcriptional regulator [Nonomuraea sp. NEAU-A123]MBT2228435.1 helix-turn-helix domain-containing protein [Nonomuraea sp. NEAU-A123]
MANFPKWNDFRTDIVANSGGEEAVTEARRHNQAYIDGYRLAKHRKAEGLTQSDVAERMGVTKSRVSQIERGEVSTIETIARYVQALGGQIQVSEVFGDDRDACGGRTGSRPSQIWSGDALPGVPEVGDDLQFSAEGMDVQAEGGQFGDGPVLDR